MKKRVPRKLKKQFKKLWKNIYYKKVFIKKSSIDYQIWPVSNGKKVWGCETYFKFK
jgi:hypothetical protein